MPESIEDIARRWKAQPDAAGAIELCDVLRKSSPIAWGPLIDEVGKLASERHSSNGDVLVAVARLYAAVERLSDAQGLLVSAGRVSPRDPGVFRLLGEVLLRRGDAERAEKVFVRAQQLGASDPETHRWIERAKTLKPVQAKAGPRAVANEVKNTSVHPVTPHPDLAPQVRLPAKLPTPGKASPKLGQPSFAEEEAPTVLRASLPAFTTMPAETVKRPPPPDEAKKPPPREQPRPATRPLAPPLPPAPAPNLPRALSPPTDAEPRRPLRDFPQHVPQADAAPALPGDLAPQARHPTGPQTAAMPRPALPSFSDEETEIKDRAEDFLNPPPSYSDPVPPAVAAPAPAPAPPPYAAAASVPRVGPAAGVAAAVKPATMPSAKEVLDSLANAGVFEGREAAAAQILWDRPTEKKRRRTAIGLSVGLAVFIAGAGFTLHEIQRRRALAHDEAEASLAKVEADLASAQGALLPQIEQTIGHAFELDSRSPRAAADWLAERALKGLLKGGGDIAFEDAVARALEVKVPEEKVAYARIAAFLFQGDTGGAAGLMPKWDGPAAKEPLYQVITGATLARAGDPHAAERYQAAVALAPDMVVAEMLLVRATAIDGDPVKAADLAKQFRTKHPDRAEGAVLVGLAWARDPARGEQAPPEVAEAIAHGADLPLPLLAVPHALAAILAVDKHATPEAKAEIEKGLAVADDPGMATWLGSIALETRDEPLVRKAALLAVTFSAVYAPARVLAGRIALLGGRLDEALKATEDLDPTSPDVAIVRAAAAYERVDADGVGRALETVPVETRKLPLFTALNGAADVLLGHEADTWPAADAAAKLLEMSRDDAPWSDLVAMDVALDLGLTDVADKIMADWKGTEDKPLKAARLSRLARYGNHLEEADHYSRTAIEAGTVTPRVLIERVLVLVAKNHAAEVGPLLGRYPLVLGPASSWLSAYALASTGKLDEARGRTAQLDFPPPLAPLPFRVMAAVSLAAMKDKKRADPAVRSLLAAGSADPDLLAAAASLGIKVVPRPVAPKPRR
jgi:hypothetical protein